MPDALTDDQIDTLRDHLRSELDALKALVKGADDRSGTVELDGSMGLSLSKTRYSRF